MSLKSELQEYCKIPRNVLRLIGIYPSEKGEYNTRIMALVLSCPAYCLWTAIYSVYLGWSDLIEISLNLCAVLCSIMCGGKYINYIFYRKEFSNFFFTIEKEFWGRNENSSKEEKKILRRYGKFCNIFMTFQLISLFFAGQLWIIEPILQMIGILPRNRNKPDLILPFETWVPSFLNKHEHPLFDILFSLQSITTMGCIIIVIASDTLYVFLVLNSCGQFRILQYRLQNFTSLEEDSKRREIYIYHCIQLHQNLCKFCNDLETCLTKVLMLQYIFSVGFLCLSGLIISLFPGDRYNFVRNVIFILASLWELFVHCFTADLLTTENFQVSRAAYNSEWYDCSDNVRKLIIFIIVRAQKPFYLTAWKFTPVSLESFEMVVRTACSYFTVFNSVKDN